ncbi:hypothetical protein [Streptomyces sp. NPDC049949]|uniref:hypothetical protein n=1 Tax=Streptomyces sp. NPDC049949 TaxID=3154627 RepID=UPI003446BCEE
MLPGVGGLPVEGFGLGPAPNPVAYVANPRTWSDPLGLTPCPPKGEKSDPFKLRSDAERARSTLQEFLSGVLLMPNGLPWVTRH